MKCLAIKEKGDMNDQVIKSHELVNKHLIFISTNIYHYSNIK